MDTPPECFPETGGTEFKVEFDTPSARPHIMIMMKRKEEGKRIKPESMPTTVQKGALDLASQIVNERHLGNSFLSLHCGKRFNPYWGLHLHLVTELEGYTRLWQEFKKRYPGKVAGLKRTRNWICKDFDESLRRCREKQKKNSAQYREDALQKIGKVEASGVHTSIDHLLDSSSIRGTLDNQKNCDRLRYQGYSLYFHTSYPFLGFSSRPGDQRFNIGAMSTLVDSMKAFARDAGYIESCAICVFLNEPADAEFAANGVSGFIAPEEDEFYFSLPPQYRQEWRRNFESEPDYMIDV